MHAVVRLGLAGLVAISLSAPAVAEDFRNYRPWDYKVRRSPAAMTRAGMMWQVDQADRAGAAQGAATAGTAAVGGAGGAAGAVSSTTSIGNMNVITVAVGQGGVADVAVETEQSNLGRVDGRSVAASGTAVNIGPVR